MGNGIPSQSHRASLVIWLWDHTVLPASRHKWTRPALTPAREAGIRFTYPGGMEGWVDLGRPTWEPRPLDRKSDALTVTPPRHPNQTPRHQFATVTSTRQTCWFLIAATSETRLSENFLHLFGEKSFRSHFSASNTGRHGHRHSSNTESEGHLSARLQVTSPKGHWSDIYVECNDQLNRDRTDRFSDRLTSILHDRCKRWFSQAITACANPNPKP